MRHYFKQRIELSFENTFSDIFLFSISLPFDAVLNTEGYYINFGDKLRIHLSNTERVAFQDISLNIERSKNEDTDRIILKMASGAILNMPENMSERDFEIVAAQLNVLLMRLDNSLKLIPGRSNKTSGQ